MSYFEKIQKDMYSAMKSRDQGKVATLRTVLSILKAKRIDSGVELSEEQEIKELRTFAKQRKEAIEMFKQGSRDDLVILEKNELKTIEGYLPQMMDEQSIRKLVKNAIDDSGATGMSDMGKVMPLVMKAGQGLIDGKTAQLIVKELLN